MELIPLHFIMQEAYRLFHHARGLPQGMAGSVLLAELAIAPLMWRLRSLPNLSAIAYVDDLNLIALSREELFRAITILREFEQHFALSLSEVKTKVWVTNPAAAPVLARESGFQATSVLDALGAQWKLNRTAVPTYPKELARLDQCACRLLRARSLPVGLPKLAQFIGVECLSLLDFINLPDIKPYVHLRSLVKEAL